MSDLLSECSREKLAEVRGSSAGGKKPAGVWSQAKPPKGRPCLIRKGTCGALASELFLPQDQEVGEMPSGSLRMCMPSK